MNRIRKITLTGLLLLFALLPLAAQEKPDTVYMFRFVTDKDMFYVPFNGNDTELERLEQCVERYRQDILAGKIPLLVDGKDKTVTYSGTLESGNAYSFNLTLKNTNSLGTRSAGTSDCELELVEVRDMYEE